jgi:hypothetical protein
MKRIILAAALSLGISVPALSQNSATLEQRGHWSSFVARTPSNSVVCGIDVIDPNDGRHLMIKWFQGSDRIIFHAVHPRWNVTPGRIVAVSFQVDGYENWSANANAVNNKSLEWHISSRFIGRFENQFRLGQRMFLGFPGAGEPSWTISLLGTNAIVNSLVDCMKSVGN